MRSFPIRLYLFAFILRLIPILLTLDAGIGLDDMFQYDMLARSISAGEGFRWYAEEDLKLIRRYVPLDFIVDDYDPRGVLTSFRPPGYPAFLALVYRLGGLENRFIHARLVQVFLSALVPVLGYLLGRRVFPGQDSVGKYTGLVLAVYPMLVAYPFVLATENTFVPLVLGSLLFLLRAGDSRRTRDYVLAGVLLGIAALTRSVISAILPLMMFWAWYFAHSRKGALILLGCVLVFTLPWSVRNTRLHGKFYYVESALGYDMFMGYHPESSGTFKYGPSLDLMPYLDDSERDELGMQMALGFIKDDPARVPYLALRKLGHFFSLERRGLTYFYVNDFFSYLPPARLAAFLIGFNLPFVIVSTSAALGLPFLPRRKETYLVGLALFGYVAPHLAILAEPRFHLAAVPFIVLLAAFTWSNIHLLFAKTILRSGRISMAVGLALVLFLWLNWGLELWRDAELLSLMFSPEGNRLFLGY